MNQEGSSHTYALYCEVDTLLVTGSNLGFGFESYYVVQTRRLLQSYLFNNFHFGILVLKK